MVGDEQAPTGVDGDSRKRILVVDDDPGHRMECRELLEDAGYAVTEAGDGRKALTALMDPTHPQPLVILLDLSMPLMDGWEFLAIMKSYVHLHGIPVILISACEPTLDPVTHGTLAAYLPKPYDPADLVALVHKFAG
jgi:two-component system NtrC family response regulator